MMEVDATGLTEREFGDFQRWLYTKAGINLTQAKKALVASRLAKRLRLHNLQTYGEYFRLLSSGTSPQELQTAVDLLTTNETYFFREPKHFEFLRDKILPNRQRGATFRVWSAASSSGEEAYSIAMLLADQMGGGVWEIMGSDLSTRVLQQAAQAQFPMSRTEHIPKRYLQCYCRRGIGAQDGTFLIDKALRQQVQFIQVNLNEALPDIGSFDVVFLRNVMIYFDTETKSKVINRIIPVLRTGGHLFIGHSENLTGIQHTLKPVAPAIYRKVI